MVFGINGNIYSYTNADKNPTQRKHKKKKEKDQLSLFPADSNIFHIEGKENAEENPQFFHYQRPPEEFQKASSEDALIQQITENKISNDLSKALDTLIQSLNESNSKQKTEDIAGLILSATKKIKPLSTQKSALYGALKLLKSKNTPLIKKKCILAIFNIIEQNNHAIRTLRTAKRPEVNIVLTSQKFILENIQTCITNFGKNSSLLKTTLNLLKNCIYYGEENIKKQCVNLLNTLTADIVKTSSEKPQDIDHMLIIYEMIKHLLSNFPALAENIDKDIRILSEKHNA